MRSVLFFSSWLFCSCLINAAEVQELWKLRADREEFVKQYAASTTLVQKPFIAAIKENSANSVEASRILGLVIDAQFTQKYVNRASLSALLDFLEDNPDLVDENILPKLFRFCNSYYDQAIVERALLFILRNSFVTPGDIQEEGSVKLFAKLRPSNKKLTEALAKGSNDQVWFALHSLEAASCSSDFPSRLDDNTAKALVDLYWNKTSDLRRKSVCLKLLMQGRKYEIAKPVVDDAQKSGEQVLMFLASKIQSDEKRFGKNNPANNEKSLHEKLTSDNIDDKLNALVELDKKSRSADFGTLIDKDTANKIVKIYNDPKATTRIKMLVLHILLEAKQYDIAKPIALKAKNDKQLSFMANAILKRK